jgi:NTE family protein
MFNHIKIGLALGGGGVKGLAHIGVLKVLEEKKINVDYIAGTSIGALIGALYCARGNAREIEKLILDSINWKMVTQVFDPNLKSGILQGDKVKHIISNWLKGARFNNLKIPLTVIATDLKKGKEVRITNGDLVKAVRASISVPFVFAPLSHRGMFLSDGGLTNPVPDDAVKRMGADLVVAVNLETGYIGGELKQKGFIISQTAIRSLNIMKQHLAKYCLESADIVIEPKVKEAGLVGWSKFFDKKKAIAIIKAGEKAAEKSLKNSIND